MKNEFITAITKLADTFVIKALDIDLNTDTFKVLKLGKYEKKNKGICFSAWIDEFINSGLISNEDVSSLKQFTDLKFLQSCVSFRRSDSIKIKYKRASFKGDEYRDSALVVIPSDKKNHIYLFVYDAQY